MNTSSLQRISDRIRNVPDFPKKGIMFKDITPLLLSPGDLSHAIDLMIDPFRGEKPQKIVAIESRGFIFGTPAAMRLGSGLVLARKEGKLPSTTIRVEYDLEYGTDVLEIHTDGIEAGEKVLIVDDVLATGGTARAVGRAVTEAGGVVVGYSFLLEITPLEGRGRLEQADVSCVISY